MTFRIEHGHQFAYTGDFMITGWAHNHFPIRYYIPKRHD